MIASKRVLYVRLPEDLYQELRQAAKTERRSISNLVTIVLEKALTNRGELVRLEPEDNTSQEELSAHGTDPGDPAQARPQVRSPE